jgi:hypothetical protein
MILLAIVARVAWRRMSEVPSERRLTRRGESVSLAAMFQHFDIS